MAQAVHRILGNLLPHVGKRKQDIEGTKNRNSRRRRERANVEIIDQTRIPSGHLALETTLRLLLASVVLFLLPFSPPETRVTGSDVLRVPVDIPLRKTKRARGCRPNQASVGACCAILISSIHVGTCVSLSVCVLSVGRRHDSTIRLARFYVKPCFQRGLYLLLHVGLPKRFVVIGGPTTIRISEPSALGFPLGLAAADPGRVQLVDKVLDDAVQVAVAPRQEQHVVGLDRGPLGVPAEALKVQGDVFS